MAKILFKKICIVLMFGLFGGTNTFAQKHIVDVVGFVVDDRGKGLYGGHVYFETPFKSCEGCIDHIIESNATGKDGVFFMERKLNVDKATLYISGPVPKNLWLAFRTLRTFPEFKGITFYFPKNVKRVEYNLGKITPTVFFKPVTIDLQQLFGKNKKLFTDKTEFRIKVKYKGTVFVKNRKVSSKAIDITNRKLEFAVPNGIWGVLLEMRNGKDKQIKNFIIDGKTVQLDGKAKVRINNRKIETVFNPVSLESKKGS